MQMFSDMASTKAEASTTGLYDDYTVSAIVVVPRNTENYHCLLLCWSLFLTQVDVQQSADEQHRDTRPGQDVAVPKVAMGEFPGVLEDVLIV